MYKQNMTIVGCQKKVLGQMDGRTNEHLDPKLLQLIILIS